MRGKHADQQIYTIPPIIIFCLFYRLCIGSSPGTNLGPLMVDSGPLPYLTWHGSALLETTAISSSSCPSVGVRVAMPPPPPPPWPTSLPTAVLSCDCLRPLQLNTSRFAVDITPFRATAAQPDARRRRPPPRRRRRATLTRIACPRRHQSSSQTITCERKTERTQR